MENKSVYILIGGGGFMGQGLRKYLHAQSCKVVVIGRSVSIPVTENEVYYSVRESGLQDIAAKLPPNHEYVVIDLAYTSVPNTSFEDPVKDFSENLYNVIRHLDFGRRVKAKLFVYISSGGTIYGDVNEAVITEEAPTSPLSPYGISKLSCEKYVQLYHKVHGLPSIIARPSNVYGPGQIPFRGQGFISTAMGLVIKKEPVHIFGDGSYIRDFLYITDFCTAVDSIIQNGQVGEIYNVSSGEGLSLLEIISAIEDVASADHAALSKIFLQSRPFDVKRNILDNEKLVQQTNWRPLTNLKSGILETWEWVQKFMQHHL